MIVKVLQIWLFPDGICSSFICQLKLYLVICMCLLLIDLLFTINGCACVQFQENEKKRYRAETLRFELKHQHQLEELRAAADTTIRELEQLQNEKRQYSFPSIIVEFH